MKIVWNTCHKELGGKMKYSIKTTSKVHVKTSKSHSFLVNFM